MSRGLTFGPEQVQLDYGDTFLLSNCQVVEGSQQCRQPMYAYHVIRDTNGTHLEAICKEHLKMLESKVPHHRIVSTMSTDELESSKSRQLGGPTRTLFGTLIEVNPGAREIYVEDDQHPHDSPKRYRLTATDAVKKFPDEGMLGEAIALTMVDEKVFTKWWMP